MAVLCVCGFQRLLIKPALSEVSRLLHQLKQTLELIRVNVACHCVVKEAEL